MLDGNELEARAQRITHPEFIERVVSPVLYGDSTKASPKCETQIVQNTGTGRLTVSYRFEDGVFAFGKLYSDDLGLHGARLTKGLWDGGFGHGNCHQVSEPLLYLPEYTFLLTRAALGTPLMSFVGDDGPEVLARVRLAARWLVELHKSPLRIGQPESLWESLKLSRVLHRITKAATMAPQERGRMIGLIERLCEKGKECSNKPRMVQTHGRYHYEHIYVSDESSGSIRTVTLIDFDRSAPSDPAKDLAEFVSVLRHKTLRRTGSLVKAEMPTRAFLEEYLSHLPENGENLAVHWGAFVLLTMFHYLKKQDSEGEESEKRIRSYEAEFDRVMMKLGRQRSSFQ